MTLLTDGRLSKLPPDAEAELAVAWAAAYPSERLALTKSITNFASSFWEILAIPVDVEPTPVIERAHASLSPTI